MKPEQIDLSDPKFKQIFHSDKRFCDCEIPMVSVKWQDNLGVFVCLRSCCAAKALEELTGIELYQVFEFPPKWVWDCEELHQKNMGDGTVKMVPRGVPPRWQLKRMLAKGIEIRNLPNGRDPSGGDSEHHRDIDSGKAGSPEDCEAIAVGTGDPEIG